MEAGKRKSVTVKTLKRVLKAAGMKTTGRKAALTRRAKKAHLMRGGEPSVEKALEKAGETGKAAVGTLEEVVKTPVEAVKGAISGQGRRRRH